MYNGCIDFEVFHDIGYISYNGIVVKIGSTFKSPDELMKFFTHSRFINRALKRFNLKASVIDANKQKVMIEYI